jgi:hypothetical protein
MMKEHMKRFCDEYDASRTDLDQWIDDLKGLPCDSMRLDRLQDSLPLYADLLKAVAADYPEAVQIWCGKDGGWGTTVTPGAQLSPRDVHRIKPGWTVPDKPYEDEWFWGEAVWKEKGGNILKSVLMFRVPDSSRCMRPDTVLYSKFKGWQFVSFVSGTKGSGKPKDPLGMSPSATLMLDGQTIYADWAVWRRTS